MVGGLLSHRVLLIGLRLLGSASSSFCSLVFCFQRLLLLSVHVTFGDSSNLIYAISLEEELGRAQSKPTHAKGIRSRLDAEQRPRSKVIELFA